MIRELSEQDHEIVFPFLKRDPSINLFIIGDIEAYGYETDFQELWGDFDDNGDLLGILLRYRDSFVVSGTDYDKDGFIEVMKGYTFSGVNGSKEHVLKLEADLKALGLVPRDTYFAECQNPVQNVSDIKVEVADAKDAERIAKLECQITEFVRNSWEGRAAEIAQKLEAKGGRTYFVEEAGEMVSVVSTTAENSLSAMVVGVATLPDYRKKGYTTAILSRILEDLLEEKESVCLFYDNPEAGSIYKRAGFADIGMWRMYMKG